MIVLGFEIYVIAESPNLLNLLLQLPRHIAAQQHSGHI
jgi:hypothetical protein